MPITLVEKEIKSRMNRPIRRLLGPLASRNINAVADPTAFSGSIVIGVKGEGIRVSNKPVDWRFKTKNDDYMANYTEIWVPDKTAYGLQSAYLSIFEASDKELLALHCDPKEPKSSSFYKYKCGPHLHISHSIIPRIKKGHIALNLSDYEMITTDIDLLDNALSEAIQMIVDELI